MQPVAAAPAPRTARSRAALKKAQLRCSMTDGYDGYQTALAERVNGIFTLPYYFC